MKNLIIGLLSAVLVGIGITYALLETEKGQQTFAIMGEARSELSTVVTAELSEV